MNIGAYIQGLIGKEQDATEFLDKELEVRRLELESKQDKLKGLRKTPGWKEVEKYMDDMVSILRRKRDMLEAGSPEDIQTKADIVAYSNIVKFVENWGS